jgi:hypothetical protein
LIAKDIAVYEPLDLISLLEDIEFDKVNNKKYIRINNSDLP